jgi:ABC-2 type transport system ATP-binding protein
MQLHGVAPVARLPPRLASAIVGRPVAALPTAINAGDHLANSPVGGWPPQAPAYANMPAAQLAATTPVILDQVSKYFGDVTGVDGISLGVARGTMLGVIGPSGAGKTTTIRIITGGIAPDSGNVRVLGEDPRRFKRRTRERIGYMPQLFVLYPDLTARENVDFMASLFGIPPWRRGKKVDEVLELVDLTDARDRRASAMSGGMQRRLELACALVHEPRLLVLDEPTAGIDPLLRTRVWQELERLRGEGVTILVTTQYVTEAEYCDDVALISDGRLVAHAPPQDLRKQALGGEVIEIGTHQPLDARSLPPVQGVVGVRQLAPAQLLFIVENAGLASPLVNDAVEAVGGTVEYSREYRPTFDEVFTSLVTADMERRKAAQATAEQVPNGQGPADPPMNGMQ